MIYRESIFVFLVFITLSCSKKNNTVYKVSKFPDIQELIWETHTISNSILLPNTMFTTQNHLIVYKQKESYLFDIFNLEPLEYLYSAGTIGTGPDDFGSLDARSFIPQKNGFSVLEAGSHILKQIEITDKIKIVSAEKIFEEHSASNGFYPLANNKYIMYGNIEDPNEYYNFNKNNKKMNAFGEYPEWTKNFKPFERFLLGIKNCVAHPDGKLFAAFYGRMKHIRFYNNDGILLHDISVNTHPFINNISSLKPEELATFYLSPQATSKYIYVLCCNKFSGKESTTPIQELQVWSWDGTPVKSYKLNKPVSLIAISEAQQKIYAINQDIDNQIYTYKLPF